MGLKQLAELKGAKYDSWCVFVHFRDLVVHLSFEF